MPGLFQGVHADPVKQGAADGLRFGQGVRRHAVGVQRGEAAHDDGFVEQAGGLRRVHQRVGFAAAAGLAEDRHVIGVTAEGGDVVPHPFQGHYQIHLAVVPGAAVAAFLAEVRVGDVAERAQSVVDGDQHHALFGEAVRVVVLLGIGGQDRERATVEPDHHRQVFGVLGRGDVKVQRVFAHAAFVDALQRPVLGGLVRPLHRVAHAVPGFRRHRRSPAQLAQRRLGVGDAQELPGAVVGFEAAQLAAGGADHRTRAGGPAEVRQRVGRVTNLARSRVGVGEQRVVLQLGH